METDDGSTTNEDTDEPTVDVVSDATDNESQISGKVLIYVPVISKTLEHIETFNTN